MMNLQRHWYRSSLDPLTFTLLPFSWLFRLIVTARRFLYRKNILKTHYFSVPVIVVGNITVGGTGKTPWVIGLANFLKKNNFRPGIVSRGVGGNQQASPRWVNENSEVKEVGDEAVLLVKRTSCPVVVGIDRVAAVTELLTKSDCNVVISDDGLQHYRMGRTVEIAIVDAQRGLGNHQFLPAGPLRESPQRLEKVDFVIQKNLRNDNQLVSLKDETRKILFENLSSKKIHAVAAIGNPEKFFSVLRANNFELIEHVFPDHYLYRETDLNFSDDLPVVMTEKDAVKIKYFAKENWWYFPVSADMDTEFEKELLNKLKKLSSQSPKKMSS